MIRVIFIIITILFLHDYAYACDPWDIACITGNGQIIINGNNNTGTVIFDDLKDSLTTSREYLSAKDIPPAGAGAYGIVVLHSKPTHASRAKLTMVCESFINFFPKSETSIVPIANQMITVWPVDDPNNDKTKADDCAFVLNHYDLNAAEAAINDARKQHGNFDGEGPYLVGWSPSNSRGVPDKLVLVVDMSADNNQTEIDHKFGFWKNKIIKNPSLWRSGWSVDGVRVAIKEFADAYGQNMLDAVKIVSGKKLKLQDLRGNAPLFPVFSHLLTAFPAQRSPLRSSRAARPPHQERPGVSGAILV